MKTRNQILLAAVLFALSATGGAYAHGISTYVNDGKDTQQESNRFYDTGHDALNGLFGSSAVYAIDQMIDPATGKVYTYNDGYKFAQLYNILIGGNRSSYDSSLSTTLKGNRGANSPDVTTGPAANTIIGYMNENYNWLMTSSYDSTKSSMLKAGLVTRAKNLGDGVDALTAKVGVDSDISDTNSVAKYYTTLANEIYGTEGNSTTDVTALKSGLKYEVMKLEDYVDGSGTGTAVTLSSEFESASDLTNAMNEIEAILEAGKATTEDVFDALGIDKGSTFEKSVEGDTYSNLAKVYTSSSGIAHASAVDVINNQVSEIKANEDAIGSAVETVLAKYGEEGLAELYADMLKNELGIENSDGFKFDVKKADGSEISTLQGALNEQSDVYYGTDGVLTLDNGGSTLEEGVNLNTAAIRALGRETKKGIAQSVALAGLHPLDFDPSSKLEFAVATGTFKNETAVAGGVFYHPNKDVTVSFGTTLSGGDDSYNASVSFKLGSHGEKAKAPADEELEAAVAALRARSEALQARIDTAKA